MIPTTPDPVVEKANMAAGDFKAPTQHNGINGELVFCDGTSMVWWDDIA